MPSEAHEWRERGLELSRSVPKKELLARLEQVEGRRKNYPTHEAFLSEREPLWYATAFLGIAELGERAAGDAAFQKSGGFFVKTEGNVPAPSGVGEGTLLRVFAVEGSRLALEVVS